MKFDLGLTRLWNGYGVLIPIVLFVIVAFMLDVFTATKTFDGGSALYWFGGFILIMLWTMYYLTGQHQKQSR